MSALRIQAPPAMAVTRVTLEAAPDELRARVEDVRLRLGITGTSPAETYGPTSVLSEDLLLRGYGLRRPRVEVEP